MKIKFGKNGNYIIIEKDCPALANFTIAPCTKREGGTDFVRVFFVSPFDLEPLSQFIYGAYLKCYKLMQEYASYSDSRKGAIEDILRSRSALSEEEVASLLKSADNIDGRMDSEIQILTSAP